MRAGSSTIHKRVQSQFGPVAEQYTTSAGHADPGALARVVALAQPSPGDRALDVATGAGHTALALAPAVAAVVAYDLTPAMLEEASRNAEARGLSNVATMQGTAESLPFPDQSFEIVTVRIAPHHFADIHAAVREMARVLRPGGRLVVVDTTVPEDDALDQQINQVEALRDPSHVRNYRESEWRSMLAAAGLSVALCEVDMYRERGRRMEFDAWTARMRTPPAAVAQLEGIFRNASPELREVLDIEIIDGRIGFVLPQVTLVATKGTAEPCAPGGQGRRGNNDSETRRSGNGHHPV
jgi:ubiquinone/menaquinone biosynthesis C-methylase UbiE